MKLTTLSSAVLVVALAILWLTVGQGESLPIPTLTTTTPTQQITQSYLEQAERWSYDANGYRDQRVKLDSAVSYTDSPTTFLTGLTFEGPDKNGRYWRVEAGAGLLKQNGQELQLRDGVKIRESLGEGVLTTPRLRILPKQNKAINRAPVTLKLRDSVTNAHGLEVDLNSGVAKLLRDVETIYEG